ncbi:MAG: type II toxin-antitoxin system ParD family antitoxin [Syntrophobacteraceae bacterium]|nr:type II toxin-antitoxin system ParD family antitoxin [Syntrophobacteraceae bacterium]
MPMNVDLTPQVEDMVKKKVAPGLYNSASEVIREALRLMEEQDRLRAIKLEQLKQDIREGLDSGDPTPWSPEEIKKEGRKRRAARATPNSEA